MCRSLCETLTFGRVHPSLLECLWNLRERLLLLGSLGQLLGEVAAVALLYRVLGGRVVPEIGSSCFRAEACGPDCQR